MFKNQSINQFKPLTATLTISLFTITAICAHSTTLAMHTLCYSKSIEGMMFLMSALSQLKTAV